MNHPTYIDISSIFFNRSIKAFFSLKNFSASGKEKTNYFAKKVGFNNSKLLVPNQIHSSNVKMRLSPGKVPNCDGTFTNQSNIVCSIQVADCLPIYFAHRSKLLFGLIHAGWRGLVNDIILASGLLLKKCNYNLSDFEVIIGPSIQNCCFEVGDDIIHNFQKRHFETLSYNKFKVDLQKLAFDKFVDIGFKAKNIYRLDDCTLCNSEKYFSFRRDGETAGRMFGLIGAKL